MGLGDIESSWARDGLTMSAQVGLRPNANKVVFREIHTCSTSATTSGKGKSSKAEGQESKSFVHGNHYAPVSGALFHELYHELSEFGRSPEHDRIRSEMIRLREQAGMSQRELSKKLGRTKTYVNKLESGEIRRIDVIELRDYLKVLGVELSDFLSE